MSSTNHGGGKRRADTLSRSFKSRECSSVGKPVAIVGNWKVSLARRTNRLGGRSNPVADDFVDRLAGRTGIKEVVYCGRHGTRLLSNFLRRYCNKLQRDDLFVF
jgi:hypothetical protein